MFNKNILFKIKVCGTIYTILKGKPYWFFKISTNYKCTKNVKEKLVEVYC